MAGDAFQFYWLWAPINWEDSATFYHLNDDEHGRPWNTHGVYVPLGTAGEAMRAVASELEFIPGTRHAARATLHFTDVGGGASRIVMHPRFHWYMKGVGYGHPEFSHGSYHGDYDETYEEYALADVDDAMNLHIQAICDVEMEGALGARRGRGVLEQLIIGPHAPSGFEETLDMAK